MNVVQPVLLTGNLTRLTRFYAELFGATETTRVPAEGPPFYLGLRIGASTLGIVADDTGAGPDVPQRVLLSVEVDDVDAMLPHVTAAGGKVTGGPNDMPWGQRVAHTTDCDGNVVNLTQQLTP